jgi:hypothetical protein
MGAGSSTRSGARDQQKRHSALEHPRRKCHVTLAAAVRILTNVRLPNVFQAKLRGRGRAATRIVARRLPRILLDSNARSAADVTPRRWCSAQGLQPRTEAGPRQLQLGVSRRIRLCVSFGSTLAV